MDHSRIPVKDETTARSDALTRLAGNALDFYEDVVGRLEDPAVRERTSKAIREQTALLRGLIRSRRAADDLPQLGDAETGHVRALYAVARASLGNGEEALLESMRARNDELAAAAEDALECELPADQSKLVRDLVESCRSFGRVLGQEDRPRER